LLQNRPLQEGLSWKKGQGWLCSICNCLGWGVLECGCISGL
jgi:hypothetical protein